MSNYPDDMNHGALDEVLLSVTEQDLETLNNLACDLKVLLSEAISGFIEKNKGSLDSDYLYFNDLTFASLGEYVDEGFYSLKSSLEGE